MRKLKTDLLIIGAAVLCASISAASLAIAVPNISATNGNFSDGDTLIIFGSEFGIKSPAAPRLWDDFEGHSIGSLIGTPVFGNYSRIGATQYSEADPYSGQGCAFSNITGEVGDPGLVSNWIPTESIDGFVSMKVKMVSSYGSLAPHNIKLIRLNAHDPDPTHGFPNYNIGSDRTLVSFNGIVNHGLPGQVYSGGFSSIPNSNDWNGISILARCGDLDTPNGFVGSVVNSDVFGQSDVMTLQSGHSSGYRSAFLCGYFSHEGYDAEVYLDDVYADISLARVELFSDSGFHEMQVPVAWADGQVEVIVNLGRYFSGETLKLVVYDQDNNASAPFIFILDNSGDSPGRSGQPVVTYD